MTEIPPSWSSVWRGRWIWDVPPDEAPWWTATGDRRSHFTYLRRVFEVSTPVPSLLARVTCDSRYVLYLNGTEIGRGPVRDDPAFLGWDDYELAPHLRVGANVLVALCRYYGSATPWWLPASQSGALGSGSFCFETHEDAAIQLVSDDSWQAVPAPWLPSASPSFHGVPPEVVDGRLVPLGIHDPEADVAAWPAATVLEARLGTIRDRPPAAPYSSPLQRSIPQLAARSVQPARVLAASVSAEAEGVDHDDPLGAWLTVRPASSGAHALTVVDLGELTLGHVHLRVAGAAPGEPVLVGAGEGLRGDGLPEIEPRRWVARYLCRGGPDAEEVSFFDAVGCRYVGALHPPNASLRIEVDERLYPRANGARFDCDDARFARLWRVGARTVHLCSTDAFVDCPGREQRSWLGDALVHSLVTFVSNPDWRLVRRQLELGAHSRRSDGLLAMAAACDVSRSAVTIPDFSLHWIRALARYWLYSGDEAFARRHLPVAEAIIERYESARGESGLLENFPGWVFIEWAQIGRDVVTAAHDALYAVALRAYSTLPGSAPVEELVENTRAGFELLWDPERSAYVDSLGAAGRGRRVSQHTNATALLADLVPKDRARQVVESVVAPGPEGRGGRLVTTATFADRPDLGAEVLWQAPADFDEDRDVVACQPFYSHILHEALHRSGFAALILPRLLRWHAQAAEGTFQEFWSAPPGRASRCHGWSACPTFDLVTYVVGLRPTAPGYTRAELVPCLGPLARAAARVPTPHGWLEVTLEDEVATLEIPDGVVLLAGGHELGAGSHAVPQPRSESTPPL